MGKQINRLLLSGGGTGGHIYPALSIYKHLKQKNPLMDCLYIGTEKGLEAQLVPEAGIPFETVRIQGIKRSLSLENIKTLWFLLKSLPGLKKTIKDFQPDVVVGTGGYVAAPVLLAASQLGIPTLIHEQNSVAGLANKVLARHVDRIAMSFPQVAKDFSGQDHKLVLTGNPRGQEVLESIPDPDILERDYGLDPGQPTVLIFGGSRGAPAINQAAVDNVGHFHGAPYQVIICTGRVHYEDIIQSLAGHMDLEGTSVRIVPYIQNMPALFQAIDLLVCRSGATTLTEITALGLPSILIPSPYVTGNHQYYNAKALVDGGAAQMILEKNLDASSLAKQIDRLMGDGESLTVMGQQAASMGLTQALDLIEESLISLVS